ncbi:MAG TPA: hypothetical protein VGN24_05690 [Rhodanobacter sp.]|jgi:hypothetical protein|nr:hypothetical protein [Rhodanobacter sp.]
MAIKEIWVHLLAYNFVRRMMRQAAGIEGALPRQLTFKHTLQRCMAYQHCLTLLDLDAVQALLRLIANRRIGQRSGRVEPRAIKQRLKSIPLLTNHRHLAREELLRHGHP